MASKGGTKRKFVSNKSDNSVAVDLKEDNNSDEQEENFLASFNEDDDSSDTEGEEQEPSDEEDDEVVFETDDEERGTEDSGASSLEDQDTKDDNEEEDDDDDNDDDDDEVDNVEASSDSDYSEYGSEEDTEGEEGEEIEEEEEEEGVDENSTGNKIEENDGKFKTVVSKGEKLIERQKIKGKYKQSSSEIKQRSRKKTSVNEKLNGSPGSSKTQKTEANNMKYDKSLEAGTSNELNTENNTTVGDPGQYRNKENDEYKSDSSDEEDIRNTVGNIPMNWYDDYKHIGYDWDGKRIIKPVKGDEIDNFLKRMEDPNFWRTVQDKQTGQDVVLSDKDVEIIERLQAQNIPDADFDDAAPWVDWFTSEVMQTPIVRVPDHKRSFLPSKVEARTVAKMVHAIKMGWMKPTEEKKKSHKPNFYMLWESDEGVESMRRIHNHIPAPKRHLPGHAESYNPPSEFLFDKREMKQWDRLWNCPWKRKLHFLPQKYSSLRAVPTYDRFVIERFQRCLDLYLCPRAIKGRLTIEPEDLLPRLPNPKDLQPFPNVMSMVYQGHTDMVRSISVEPKGQYLVSGSDDLTVKVWEIATGRCVRTFTVGGIVRSVSWCPNQVLSLIAVAADRKVLLINPGVGDILLCNKTDSLLEEAPVRDVEDPPRVKAAVQWEEVDEENKKQGIRIIINHFKEVRQVTWHGRGDYFASVMPEGQNRSVIIHQLSKRRSQLPFTKSKGLIQCVLFHPIRPYFFVATQKHVRIYDLAKQELVKKLLSNSKWISCMAIHPGGDNLLVGTYDRKMVWFDLDLSTKPYQTLRLHQHAIRGVAFHKQYPLFATGSDDRNVIVSHGMVYNDLLQNPLLVPLKKLRYHCLNDDFSVFEVVFHPTQPWLFSSGADKTIRLYT